MGRWEWGDGRGEKGVGIREWGDGMEMGVPRCTDETE